MHRDSVGLLIQDITSVSYIRHLRFVHFLPGGFVKASLSVSEGSTVL